MLRTPTGEPWLWLDGEPDGWCDGRIMGTSLHGVFDSVTHSATHFSRTSRGFADANLCRRPVHSSNAAISSSISVADSLAPHLDVEALWEMMGIPESTA